MMTKKVDDHKICNLGSVSAKKKKIILLLLDVDLTRVPTTADLLHMCFSRVPSLRCPPLPCSFSFEPPSHIGHNTSCRLLPSVFPAVKGLEAAPPRLVGLASALADDPDCCDLLSAFPRPRPGRVPLPRPVAADADADGPFPAKSCSSPAAVNTVLSEFRDPARSPATPTPRQQMSPGSSTSTTMIGEVCVTDTWMPHSYDEYFQFSKIIIAWFNFLFFKPQLKLTKKKLQLHDTSAEDIP
jgi:hypothetical protein